MRRGFPLACFHGKLCKRLWSQKKKEQDPEEKTESSRGRAQNRAAEVMGSIERASQLQKVVQIDPLAFANSFDPCTIL